MSISGVSECPVRRSCYSVQSPGGRGARWEWARLADPPRAAELRYDALPMEVHILLYLIFISISLFYIKIWIQKLYTNSNF